MIRPPQNIPDMSSCIIVRQPCRAASAVSRSPSTAYSPQRTQSAQRRIRIEPDRERRTDRAAAGACPVILPVMRRSHPVACPSARLEPRRWIRHFQPAPTDILRLSIPRCFSVLPAVKSDFPDRLSRVVVHPFNPLQPIVRCSLPFLCALCVLCGDDPFCRGSENDLAPDQPRPSPSTTMTRMMASGIGTSAMSQSFLGSNLRCM